MSQITPTTTPEAGFTVCQHDKFFGPAALRLRPNAYRLLLAFERVWSRETRSGRRRVDSVAFTLTTCPFSLDKGAYRDARAELVAAGFISVKCATRGLYAASEAWRSAPTLQESAPPPPRDPVSKPLPRGGKTTGEGEENPPARGWEIHPLINKFNTHRTTTTTNHQSTLKVKERVGLFVGGGRN